jgi:hypothetical protein
MVLSAIFPLHMGVISESLDGSWVSALVYARESNLQFGTQIIFTGGPLSYLYNNQFSSPLIYERFCMVFILSVFFASFFWIVLTRSTSNLTACLIFFPFLTILMKDPIYIGVPLCASLALTVLREGMQRWGFLVLGASAAAVATLAKFSVFPMAVGGFLLADIAALASRRSPFSLIGYFLALSGIFWWLSPPDTSFLAYMQTSLDVASGYAEAMNVTGPLYELAIAVVMSACILALVSLAELENFRRHGTPALVAASRSLIAAIYIFLCMKMGFVRHDAHPILAWQGFGFVTAVLCALAPRTAPRAARALVVILILNLIAGQYWVDQIMGSSAREVLYARLVEPLSELLRWRDLLVDPKSWMAAQQQHQAYAMAGVRAKQPLPMLEGTVDAVPSIQAALIAHGLNYSPRPTIQEYSTYTEGLIQRNRAFFTSSSAPKYLLMTPGSIDGRHPASAEGALWPEFLARYTPEDIIGNLVLLRRRDRPLGISLHDIGITPAAFGIPVDIASFPPGLLFTKIDVAPTVMGRLANLLFKSAEIYIDIQYVDGSEKSYRLIPAMARQGFLLSPLVETATDYFALAAGSEHVIHRRARSFGLRTGRLGRWLWQSKFAVTLATLDTQPIRHASDLESMPSKPRQQLELLDLLYQNHPKAGAELIPEGLLVHAPTELTLTNSGHRALKIAFGLVDSSWQGNERKTDGVCFRVSSTEQLGPLFQRCLNPREEQTDRGPQAAQIALPDEVKSLLLETTCRTDYCGWTWAYWGQVSLRDEPPVSGHETGQQDKAGNR